LFGCLKRSVRGESLSFSFDTQIPEIAANKFHDNVTESVDNLATIND
jgi:hypothetical protein